MSSADEIQPQSESTKEVEHLPLDPIFDLLKESKLDEVEYIKAGRLKQIDCVDCSTQRFAASMQCANFSLSAAPTSTQKLTTRDNRRLFLQPSQTTSQLWHSSWRMKLI